MFEGPVGENRDHNWHERKYSSLDTPTPHELLYPHCVKYEALQEEDDSGNTGRIWCHIYR